MKGKQYRTPAACYKVARVRRENPRESFYRQQGQLPALLGHKIILPPFVKGVTYTAGRESGKEG